MRCSTRTLCRFVTLLVSFQFGTLLQANAQQSDLGKGKRFEGPALPVMRADGVVRMKLVSPGVGWALAGGHLLWTNNDGVLWNDITPKASSTLTFSDVFFLDSLHGWLVAVSTSDGSRPATMQILRTDDGGSTWKSFDLDPFSYPSLSKVVVAPASLSFTDSQHGWFLWKVQTSSAFSAGKLLVTDDGGGTWKELPDPPSGNRARFHSKWDGWMTGGATESELWATHDGGITWEQKSIPAPSNCMHCRPVYDIPSHRDSENAVLSVTFIDDSAHQERHLHNTYATRDGGSHWQIAETYEQVGNRIKTPITSTTNMHAVHVFSDAQRGIQVQNILRDCLSEAPSLHRISGMIPKAGWSIRLPVAINFETALLMARACLVCKGLGKMICWLLRMEENRFG
jgi:photosystem II stability/assembly factor-like uncharacterized protein